MTRIQWVKAICTALILSGGGYTGGWVARDLGVPWWLAAVCGALWGLGVGAALGMFDEQEES